MWLDRVERVGGNNAGSMIGGGSRKLLLHTTEGSSIAGATGAYHANNSWPHLTVDCRKRRAVQHLPLNVAARSLKNLAGGEETNRDGAVLVQIEIVGFAGSPESIGSPGDLEWFGREVVAPIARLTGIPLTSTVRWVPYPASFGRGAAQRLHGDAWDRYSGVCGHQHADENDHGDPGAIDINRILSAARGEDDMPLSTTDLDEIKTAMRLVLNEGTGPGQTTWKGTSAATLATSQAAINLLNVIRAAVGGLDGVDVDEAAVAAAVVPAVLAGLAPEQLAEAIAEHLDTDAQGDLLDALAARLAG